MKETKTIAVLGSTGSIGKQALEVAEHEKLRVRVMSFKSDVATGEAQIRRFLPEYCCVSDESAARELRARVSDLNIRVLTGAGSTEEALGETKPDICLNAVSGFAGISPTLSAIKHCKRLATANKEAIVCAGELIKKEAAERKTEIIPVDSEHSAIFQCLTGEDPDNIASLILTCSGGAFFGRTAEELRNVTAAEALGHPTWKMGAKITVDCATLMNKGLEIIEAMYLFGIEAEKIEVVIHRESVIHSLVRFRDNSIKAQLGPPDMRLPIQYAVTYPERHIPIVPALDLTTVGKMTFSNPDTKTFPLLELAKSAARRKGLMPCVMNAANEVAVSAFMRGKIRFGEIPELVYSVTSSFENRDYDSLDEIIAADTASREKARETAGLENGI